MKIKFNLKQYRYDAEMTQQEIADIIGISRQRVAVYEKQGHVSDRHIYKLCKLFNVSLEEVEY